MRIVLATQHFSIPGGSETYLLTVAEQLLRLGHDTTIFAGDLGHLAEIALGRGLRVAAELDDLPGYVDVILSQDGIVAHELSERYPQTPQVFVCHSTQFELQSPPSIPGVVSAVVVLSDRFENRVRALDTPHRIVRLRQPIDVERLVPRGAPRQRPQKALLLGNYLRGKQRRVLVDAWASAGIEVVQVGSTSGHWSLHPENDIAAADIVIGKGRAILDAMSCGRPAYLYDVFGTDGWVTPEAYPMMEADAFAGLAMPRVFDIAQLRRDLDDYDPLMGFANRELIMTHHHARTHAEQLVGLFREVAPAAAPYATPRRELARLIRAKWHAEVELYKLRSEMAPIIDRGAEAAAEAASLCGKLQRQEAETASVRAELDAIRTENADLLRRINSRRVRVGLALGQATDFIRTLGKPRR